MSKVIDERVVSMQFDNKQFESNVQTTMSTLDKLKAKLNFANVGKSLDSINTSAANCNLAPLSNAVDNVGLKFNAMYTIADQALRNITNSAMAAGKKIISALTVDPIKTGFQEYETQINATQTILSNTKSKGSDINDVNKALEELNKYADLTIYNFTEMTRNIGTFTAAGIDLDTSVNAIQGIANLAAVSGSTSQQASTAMYQLSQALSSGTVRLMDWNSVVNAGMGGEMFQNALRETSELLGTGAEAAIKTAGSFRESLKDGWLSAEVLTQTLKKFTTSGANERVAEYTGLTKEAVAAAIESAKAQYGEADAIEHASKALAKKSGKNAEEIKNVLEFAKDAEDAATKVKTLTQLWDVMKESAQSGWAQTWKIIVGDFEEARELFTPLADFFTGVIGRISDARNNLLEGALNFPAVWQSITDKISSSLGIVKKVTDSIGDMSDKVTYFQDIVNDVWRGDYATSDTGRYEMLEAAGYDHRVVQDLVNLGYQYEITVDDIKASHKKFGLTVQDSTKSTEDLNEALQNLSDEQLREAGLTEAEIKVYRDLAKEAERTGRSISELADDMSKVSGRTLLIESLKNAGKGIVGIFTAMGEAWNAIFPPMSVVRLYTLIESLHTFSEKLVLTEATTEKLTRAFKGVFAAIDIVATLLGGGFRIAFQVVSKVLSLFDMDILGLVAHIGDMLVNVRDWIDEHNILNKTFDAFGPKIKEAVNSIKQWIEKTQPMAKILEGLGYVFDKVSTCVLNWMDNLFKTIPVIMEWLAGIKDVKNISDYIANGITSGIGVILNALTEVGKAVIAKVKDVLGMGSSNGAEFAVIGAQIVQGLVKGLIAGSKLIWGAMIELGNVLITTIKDLLGIHSPSLAFFTIGTFIILGLVGGIIAGSSQVRDAIKNVATKAIDAIKSINFGKMLEKPLNAISDFKDKILDKLGPVGEAIRAFGQKIKDFVTSLDIGFGEIITILVGTGMVIALIKFVRTFGNVVNLLTNISDAFAGIGESISRAFKNIGRAVMLIGLATSIAILAKAFVQLATLEWDDIAKGSVAMVAIGAILIGLSAVLGLLSKKSLEITTGAATMIGMAAAIAILAYALHLVTQIKSEHILQDILVLGGIGVALAAVTIILSKMAPNLSKGSIAMIAIASAILLLVYAVSKIESLVITDPNKLVLTLTSLIVGLGLVSMMAKGLKIGSAMGVIAMVAAILLFTHAIERMADIKMAKIKANIGEIVLILGMLALVLLMSKLAGGNALKAGVALLAISASLILVGVAIRSIASISAADMTKGTEVISQILLLFGLITVASALAGKNAIKAGLMINAMALSLLVIVGALFLMSKIAQNNEGGFELAKNCILELMAMFALIMVASALAKSAMGTMIVIGVVLGLLTVAIGALSMIPADTLIRSVTCIAGIMAAFAGLIAVTALINTGGAAFLKTATILIIMTGIVYVLGMVIRQIAELEPQNALAATASLSVLLLSLAAACAIVAVAGMVGLPAALAGIGAFVIFIAAIAALMWSIQELVTDAEAASAGLDVAIMVLEKIGNGIGSFIGGIIGGLGAGIFSGLEAMAEDLNDFMNTLTREGGFIEGAKSIDDAAINGVTNIAILLGILSGANILDIVTSKLFGEQDLGAFGAKLVSFGASLVLFGAAIRSLTEDDITKINMAADAAKALTKMASSVPNMGGKLAEWLGENDLSVFGDKLVSFGSSLVLFSESIRTLTDEDIAKIEISADAAFALTEMAGNVPNMGGKLAEWLGENDLSVFGGKLVSFGTSLVKYSESISSLTKKDINLISMSGEAGIALADMATAVPNMGGLLADWLGENDLSVFGDKLVSFGESLVQYSNSIKGLTKEDIEAIDLSADAATALAKMAEKVPNEGGWLGAIVGENSLTAFADDLEGFGTSILTYAESVTGLNNSHVDYIKKSGDAVDALAKVAKKVPNEGGVVGFFAGNNNVSGFSEGVSALGFAIKDYVTAVTGINSASVDTIKSSKDAVEAMSNVAKAIPNEGGLAGLFAGKNDIAGFSANMLSLGKSIVDYISVVASIDSAKVDIIKNSKTAITEMAAAAKALPNEGGMAGLFGGENSSATGFAANMLILGNCINNYIALISGIDDTKVEAIKKSEVAIKAMTAAAKALPNEGGVAGFFAGENSSATGFSANMNILGKCVMDYISLVSGIDDTKVEAIKKSEVAIKAMTAAAKALPNEGGVAGFFAGENSSATGFAANMNLLGKCINDYIAVVSGIDDTDIDLIKNSKDAIEKMGEAAKKVPTLNEKTTASIGIISSQMPALGTAISNYANNVSSIDDADVKSAKRAVDIVDKFKDAVGKLSDIVIGATTTKVDTAISTIKKILTFAKETGNADASGLASIADNLKTAATEGIDAFISACTNRHDDVRGAGRTLIMKFADGVPDRTYYVKQKIADLLTEVKTAVSGGSTDAYDSGKNIATSFASGISDYTYKATAKAKAMAEAAVAVVNEALGINSPSKVFKGIAAYTVEGFVIGIQNGISTIVDTSEEMAKESCDAVNGAMTALNSFANFDIGIDCEPVIAPIVDMTNVENSASTISDLFSSANPTSSIVASVSGISADMNSMDRNAGSDEIVTAINKLSDKLENLETGDNYSINGITYDDGSNIANAMNSIVRACRLQGRS